MDATAKPPPDMTGIPFTFTGYEIAECYDHRGKFRLGELRRQQNEKGLQVILSGHHGIATKWPEEVYTHVTPLSFSLIKARRMHPPCYLMTIEYRCQGVTWQHVFRFERNTNGGVSGRLYTHARRPIAK